MTLNNVLILSVSICTYPTISATTLSKVDALLSLLHAELTCQDGCLVLPTHLATLVPSAPAPLSRMPTLILLP